MECLESEKSGGEIMPIEKGYRASCGYCSSVEYFRTYGDALAWQNQHRLGCPTTTPTDSGENRRENVACPDCGDTRPMRIQNYQRSRARHIDLGTKELIGICRECWEKRRKVIELGVG